MHGSLCLEILLLICAESTAAGRTRCRSCGPTSRPWWRTASSAGTLSSPDLGSPATLRSEVGRIHSHVCIPSFSGALIPSFSGALIPSFSGALIPSFSGALIPSFSGALIPSFSGALIPSFSGALIPSFIAEWPMIVDDGLLDANQLLRSECDACSMFYQRDPRSCLLPKLLNVMVVSVQPERNIQLYPTSGELAAGVIHACIHESSEQGSISEADSACKPHIIAPPSSRLPALCLSRDGAAPGPQGGGGRSVMHDSRSHGGRLRVLQFPRRRGRGGDG